MVNFTCTFNDNVEALVRGLGLICGCVLMLEGILCFISCALDVRAFINSCHLIIFGFLAVCAESRWTWILSKFAFLLSYFGRGVYYLFIGTLALSNEWWKILICIILCVVGLINLYISACVPIARQKDVEMAAKVGVPVVARSDNPAPMSASGAPIAGSSSSV
eukprot:TRINITY_DN5551_c0_g5_i2.p1 TRINITY_DN5551_c0_g5~~TRINITY_DN5551_c0_g5_i2.p1  ORF type:complete len:163 (-),score=35.72 TRINITY_DN5551_c0_g5_i2:107-595(-)